MDPQRTKNKNKTKQKEPTDSRSNWKTQRKSLHINKKGTPSRRYNGWMDRYGQTDRPPIIVEDTFFSARYTTFLN